MSSKRIFSLALLLVAALFVLAACSGPAPAEEPAAEEPMEEEPAAEEPMEEEPAAEEPTEEEPMAEEPAAEEGPFVFGVILVGPQNDHGWSQAHYEGGSYVEENVDGTQMIVFESLNSADKPEATLESVTAEMISQGAKLIFTTSDEFEEDTLTVAQENSDVTFINVSGDDAWADGREFQAPSNLGNLMGRMEDMKAVAGCAAAMATETGKIAYLGPLVNFETRRLVSSAYLGARYCYENYRGLDPADLEFEVVWIGFWFNIPGVTLDPTEVVNQFIDGGADVVLSGIDTTEAIVVSGQRSEQGERVYAIPYDYLGACDEAPDICLGVPYFSWGPEYANIVQAVKDGTYEQDWVWSAPDWNNLTDPTKTSVGWVAGPALEANEEWSSAVDGYIASLASGDTAVWAGPINLQDGTEYVAADAVGTDQDVWYLPQLLEGMSGSSD